MNALKILCVGDIVGPAAVAALENALWTVRGELHADLVIANGENAAVGNGLDMAGAKSLLRAGVDVITSGNHIFQKKEIRDYINAESRVIRPANYPASCPGAGYTYADAKGYRVLVINILGTVFMEPLDNPFFTVEKILAREAGNYDFAVLDVHAEATSEKAAIARYFDGRIGVVFGTHTHVQTADAGVLSKGTGYVTDLGMTGVQDSILGVQSEIIIEKMMTKMPVKFALATGAVTLCGALFIYDTDTKRTVAAELIRRELK